MLYDEMLVAMPGISPPSATVAGYSARTACAAPCREDGAARARARAVRRNHARRPRRRRRPSRPVVCCDGRRDGAASHTELMCVVVDDCNFMRSKYSEIFEKLGATSSACVGATGEEQLAFVDLALTWPSAFSTRRARYRVEIELQGIVNG